MEKRKELKRQYKEMRPEMGVFAVRSFVDGKIYLEAAADLKSAMNACKFKLQANMHPHKSLQRKWNEFGKQNFVLEILDVLEYSKDEAKTDYDADLEILKSLCEERLPQDSLYKG